MKLTSRDKITIFAIFGAAVLTAILNIGVREWYSPDVRYEEGSYYITGQKAVTSLKLVNYGYSDAEDIIINSKFNKIIYDVTTDEFSPVFNTISGGKGYPTHSGKISRLVPKQKIFIYYAIDLSSLNLSDPPKKIFLQVIFKGGMGRTGTPYELYVQIVTLISLLFYAILIIIMLIKRKQNNL